MEEFNEEVDPSEERNLELTEVVMLQFMGTAYVGVVEWWITHGMPHSPTEMAKQVGILLERIV
ncbi:TetR-like C-terminal domain-containing protein [Paenibacillus sonchi]|uniref:TetR-like C-terminal domain-containing protein n=1 Tax=Paenibacillus sonchi TaxID=373687 RepID=UPI00227747C0|nr:TetR-like C-terminal domain-containing protein [Paenibacillus sonchi]